MTKEFLEKCLAGGLSLDQIARSVGKHPSTVSHHLKKYGLTPLGHEIHAPNQKVDGDRLRHLISDGATVREAAATFGVGYSTIRYWLRRLGLETRRMQRLRQSRAAADASGARQIRQCPRHGRVPHVRRADGDSFRCIKCRSEAVSKRRRTVKKLLVERAGGRCQLCGYDRHPAALHFHHLDPRAKNFILSRNGVTRSYSEAKAEADKCVLLCGNCHAEVEAGVIQLPNRLTLKLPEDRAS